MKPYDPDPRAVSREHSTPRTSPPSAPATSSRPRSPRAARRSRRSAAPNARWRMKPLDPSVLAGARPFLHRAAVARRQVDLRQLPDRPQAVLGVFVAQPRFELAPQPAAVGDDEHVATGDDLEKVRVDWRLDRDVERQLFGELAREGMRVFLGPIGAATGQFPFVARIPHQHYPPIEAQHAFDRDLMVRLLDR